jgi:hypothetical protein
MPTTTQLIPDGPGISGTLRFYQGEISIPDGPGIAGVLTFSQQVDSATSDGPGISGAVTFATGSRALTDGPAISGAVTFAQGSRMLTDGPAISGAVAFSVEPAPVPPETEKWKPETSPTFVQWKAEGAAT